MKISIITVCYNSENFISSAINSVLSQAYSNIEFIVIDGGSKDSTVSIIESFGNKISYFVSEEDKGIYDAMNKGIMLAKGDVIGFLNSDDFYASNDVLSRVAGVFEKDPSLDACYADLIYTDQIDILRGVRYWRSGDYLPSSFSKGWCPPHPTFFVRGSVYERLGIFDLSYRIASDVELMMRFLEVHKIRVQHVPEVWVKMRMGGTTNNSLKNIWVQNQEVLRALRSYGLPTNSMRFFGHKLLSRGKQFFQRPSR